MKTILYVGVIGVVLYSSFSLISAGGNFANNLKIRHTQQLIMIESE